MNEEEKLLRASLEQLRDDLNQYAKAETLPGVADLARTRIEEILRVAPQVDSVPDNFSQMAAISPDDRSIKAYSVYLFTNRNCLVFNDKGEQIQSYQRAITCYTLDKKVARVIADEAQLYYIADYRNWIHQISQKHFEYMLGLRTRKDDLKVATERSRK